MSWACNLENFKIVWPLQGCMYCCLSSFEALFVQISFPTTSIKPTGGEPNKKLFFSRHNQAVLHQPWGRENWRRLVLQAISEFATIVSIITEINQGAWPSFHTNVLLPHSLCYLFIYFYQRVYFAFEKKFRDLWDVGHDGHLYKCCSNHPSSRFCDSSSVSRIWNKNERNAPSQKVRAAAKGLENRSSS